MEAFQTETILLPFFRKYSFKNKSQNSILYMDFPAETHKTETTEEIMRAIHGRGRFFAPPGLVDVSGDASNRNATTTRPDQTLSISDRASGPFTLFAGGTIQCSRRESRKFLFFSVEDSTTTRSVKVWFQTTVDSSVRAKYIFSQPVDNIVRYPMCCYNHTPGMPPVDVRTMAMRENNVGNYGNDKAANWDRRWLAMPLIGVVCIFLAFMMGAAANGDNCPLCFGLPNDEQGSASRRQVELPKPEHKTRKDD